MLLYQRVILQKHFKVTYSSYVITVMNDSVTIYEEEEYADFKELILYQNYLLGLTISDGI